MRARGLNAMDNFVDDVRLWIEKGVVPAKFGPSVAMLRGLWEL